MKQRLFSILASLLLALTATSMWADEFIKDVMVIGGSKTEVNNLKTTLSAQGWTVINQDLNAKASGDYIYLLYKSESNSDGVNYGYITDFYISNERGVAPDTRIVNGRTYYLVPYDGSNYFTDVERKGDLNSNAGGDYIHLYYTRDFFADKRAVKGITFNSTKSGAVGVNGGTTGYDLNSGAGGDYIYMHLTTGTAVLPFPGSGTAASPFLISSAADWSRFVTCISKGLYVDWYYMLAADIGVTEMAGTNEHSFAGHFDGNSHTLTRHRLATQTGPRLTTSSLQERSAAHSMLAVSWGIPQARSPCITASAVLPSAASPNMRAVSSVGAKT